MLDASDKKQKLITILNHVINNNNIATKNLTVDFRKWSDLHYNYKQKQVQMNF